MMTMKTKMMKMNGKVIVLLFTIIPLLCIAEGVLEEAKQLFSPEVLNSDCIMGWSNGDLHNEYVQFRKHLSSVDKKTRKEVKLYILQSIPNFVINEKTKNKVIDDRTGVFNDCISSFGRGWVKRELCLSYAKYLSTIPHGEETEREKQGTTYNVMSGDKFLYGATTYYVIDEYRDMVIEICGMAFADIEEKMESSDFESFTNQVIMTGRIVESEVDTLRRSYNRRKHSKH